MIVIKTNDNAPSIRGSVSPSAGHFPRIFQMNVHEILNFCFVFSVIVILNGLVFAYDFV